MELYRIVHIKLEWAYGTIIGRELTLVYRGPDKAKAKAAHDRCVDDKDHETRCYLGTKRIYYRDLY